MPPCRIPLAGKPLTHTALGEQIDASLLEDPGANALDHVFLGADLHDDRLDSQRMKEMAEHETGGSRADNADLGAGGHGVF